MPFKAGRNVFGLSKDDARKRFNRLECTLRQNVDLFQKYAAIIREFFERGHFEKVQPVAIDSYPNINLLHQCVLKEDSSATKLRVVFDASAKTTTGVTLND